MPVGREELKSVDCTKYNIERLMDKRKDKAINKINSITSFVYVVIWISVFRHLVCELKVQNHNML
jgi:hypothetical protein